MQVLAYVSRVKDVGCSVDNSTFTLADIEANDVRCPDAVAAKAMYAGEFSAQYHLPKLKSIENGTEFSLSCVISRKEMAQTWISCNALPHLQSQCACC